MTPLILAFVMSAVATILLRAVECGTMTTLFVTSVLAPTSLFMSVLWYAERAHRKALEVANTTLLELVEASEDRTTLPEVSRHEAYIAGCLSEPGAANPCTAVDLRIAWEQGNIVRQIHMNPYPEVKS